MSQCRRNGTRQMCIVKQTQVCQSRQLPQRRWNGTTQLIFVHTQVYELLKISQRGWDGTTHLILTQPNET